MLLSSFGTVGKTLPYINPSVWPLFSIHRALIRLWLVTKNYWDRSISYRFYKVLHTSYKCTHISKRAVGFLFLFLFLREEIKRHMQHFWEVTVTELNYTVLIKNPGYSKLNTHTYTITISSWVKVLGLHPSPVSSCVCRYLFAVSVCRSGGFVRAWVLGVFAPGFGLSGVSKRLTHLHLRQMTTTFSNMERKTNPADKTRGVMTGAVPSLWTCPRSSCWSVSGLCWRLPRL